MNDYLIYLALVLLGFALGLLVAYWAKWFRSKTSGEIAASLFSTSQESQRESLDRAMSEMKASFSSLSIDVLNKSTDELVKRAQSVSASERELSSKELEGKKVLIDSQLGNLHKDLDRMTELVRSMEKERGTQLGSMSNQLKITNTQTASLIKTTSELSDVLSNSQVRGQWGERIAEDVLKLAGFIENISYTKQNTLEDGSRPDFTFILPRDLTLNMDVKFPIANYSKFVEAKEEIEKDRFKKAFFKDVKARLKEVTTRGYISEVEKTVDCVLLFIPNEQVFSFIQSENPEILDEAMKNKVICCSPLTLFAVLAVVRQSVDNFSLERTSGEILALMSAFKKQWSKYLTKFETLGKRLSDTQNEYDALATTRTRLLDNSLEKIEKLKNKRILAMQSEESLSLDDQISDSDAMKALEPALSTPNN